MHERRFIGDLSKAKKGVRRCPLTTIGSRTSVRMLRPVAKTKHAGGPSSRSDAGAGFASKVVSSFIGMIILVLIWAIAEYHNAGGWPTHGFSQSSGIHDVWNFWIIYPIIGWVLILAARAWSVYGNKPISESEIKREIERQSGNTLRPCLRARGSCNVPRSDTSSSWQGDRHDT